MSNENLLKNGSFEGGWTRDTHTGQAFGEIYTPENWTWWWEEGGEFRRPECQVINKEPPFLDPPRVSHGERAVKCFTMFGRTRAALYQVVDGLEPGVWYRFSAEAHAWSVHTGVLSVDRPHCSAGVGCGPVCIPEDEIPEPNGDPLNDAIGNFVFRLGVQWGDPDPEADNIVWGNGAAIYNVFHEIPAMKLQVPNGGRITLYIKSESKYPFQTSDSYFDNARLVKIEEPSDDDNGDDEPAPQPPEDYPYPIVAHGAKVGVHAIRPNRVREFATTLQQAGTHFPVVKAVDDFGWVRALQEASPETIILARRTWWGEGCEGVGAWGYEDMLGHANSAIDLIVDAVNNNPNLRDAYWEPYNEPDPPGPGGYAALAELQKVTMDMAEKYGLKLALFSLNAGTPEWDEMVDMVDTGVFARARQGGHILSLHEGTFVSHDPKQWWGDLIPGATQVEGAGALNFRYRYLYHLLEQRDEVIPLVVSEWYCGDEESAETGTIIDALRWYDDEASKDYYFWATCPFTLGPTKGWEHTDYERFYPGLVQHMIAIRDRDNALPPSQPVTPPVTNGDRGKPRVQYERTYNVIPQDATESEAMAIFIGGWRRSQETTGGSYDDAGVGDLDVRTVNLWGIPEDVRQDFEAFYDEYYPGVDVEFLDFDTEVEEVIWDRDLTGELMTGDGQWFKRRLSEIRGVTIHHTCSDSPHATAEHAVRTKGLPGIQYTYWVTQTGEILKCVDEDAALYHDHQGYPNYHLSVGLAGKLHKYQPVDVQLEAAARLCRWALDNEEMNVKYVRGHQDYYSTECPGWHTGWKKRFYDLLESVEPGNGGPDDGDGGGSTHLLVGLHDEPGGEWMVRNGVSGCCLAHYQVQRQKVDVDLRHLQDAGITTIARLNWGYADGTGTLPPPADRNPFTSAAVSTILSGRGVDYWHVGNEPNNRSEWPRGYDLTPQYITDIYNDIHRQVQGKAKLGPPPLDPYFGPGSNNMDWWQYLLTNIEGADAFYWHLKTQSNNPDDVWSKVKFSDWPLEWQYMNMRSVEPLLNAMPFQYVELPMFVTECNPQHLEHSGGELGWKPGNARWVHEACTYLRQIQMDGVVFYRYELAGDQAGFGLNNKPQILHAIKDEAST